jgi:GST-like protein
MSDAYRVYGTAGSGSVAVEAALTLLKLPYTTVEAAPWGGPEDRAILEAESPLQQVPVVILPSGEKMTESAALLIHLGDLDPAAGLAPPPGDPRRPAYLRWMVFIPANIYAMYTLKDDPSRWLHDTAAGEELRDRAIDHIKTCWQVMEAAVEPAPWILGERMSLLDVYVTLVSRWTPRRRWFETACPKLYQVVRRVDELPELADFWKQRFPFSEGWEA